MDYIPRVSPRYEAPLHMRPFVDVLERAPGGGLRVALSAPPQHVKTSTIQHFLAKLTGDRPELRNIYSTYSADRSQRVGRVSASIAAAAGLQLELCNLDLWRTREGGQTLWTSVGGGMTGEACDGVAIIDDPLKDRKEAESPLVRENQKDWFHSVLETRVHPGASIIVMMTRWHPDDLVGYLVKHCGFEYINLKAIADERRPPGDNRQPGEALWPSKRPLEMLLERRRSNEWNFSAMYQGEPRPRGGALFREPTYWSELPEHGFRVNFGVDLNYSEKTHADFSVCLELWAVPPSRAAATDAWTFYITDVVRKQVEAPAFALTLRAKSSQRPGKFYWYASGTEKGAAQFIQSKNIPLVVMDPAGRDKFTRAQQTAELWNAGRILVPADTETHPWADVFSDEVTSFTGVKDLHDDQVDALVAAIDAAIKGGGHTEIPRRTGGRWG